MRASRDACYNEMQARLMQHVRGAHLPCTCESESARCCVCWCAVSMRCLSFKSYMKNEVGISLSQRYNACPEECLSGKAADWMTHPEKVGPQEEVA